MMSMGRTNVIRECGPCCWEVLRPLGGGLFRQILWKSPPLPSPFFLLRECLLALALTRWRGKISVEWVGWEASPWILLTAWKIKIKTQKAWAILSHTHIAFPRTKFFKTRGISSSSSMLCSSSECSRAALGVQISNEWTDVYLLLSLRTNVG